MMQSPWLNIRNKVGDEVSVGQVVRVISFGCICDQLFHRGVISYVDEFNDSVDVTLDEPLCDVIGNPIKRLVVSDLKCNVVVTPLDNKITKLLNRTAVTRAFDEVEAYAEKQELNAP